ncbi:ABC transporter permease subunit [Actinomadura sp. LD22]|uniref:ABC transporter permease subunit n=1 Tax=Actinomadura physcomitrii TaxID=2650748 RepID=A0A6I4MAJ9_9ACTN|nr:ABC transporter permease subunit [Actinomadura physcomitrii]
MGRAGRRWVTGAAGFAVLCAAAEAAGRAGWVDRSVLPLTSTVLVRAVRLAGDAAFLRSVLATAQMWGAGVLAAAVLAVPAGLILGTSPRLDAVIRPIVEFLRPIPAVALIPLTLLVVGDDTRMTVTVIAYACCWPILIHTMYGLHDVDPVATDTLRAYGFGRLAVLWRVALPSAAPFIATGVRVAAGIGLIVAVSAELLAGGGSGLGTWLIALNSGVDQTDVVLATIIWMGVLSVVVDTVLMWGKRRLFRWHDRAVAP